MTTSEPRQFALLVYTHLILLMMLVLCYHSKAATDFFFHFVYLTSFWIQEKFDLPPDLGRLDAQPLLDVLLRLPGVAHISQHRCGDCCGVMAAMLHQHEVTNLGSGSSCSEYWTPPTCLATVVRGVEKRSQNVEPARWVWTMLSAMGTRVVMMVSGSSSDGTYSSPAIRLNFKSLEAWSLNTMIVGDCRLLTEPLSGNS